MSFGDLMDAADAMIEASLSDGLATYLSQAGSVLVEGVPVELNRNIEHPDLSAGVVERITTLSCRKVRLAPYDRRGSFVLDGTRWHIEKPLADDGQWITFYVRP